MAKGNMLLGYSRGKVGDVVFSRQNGEQITRARNRYPRNPRSNGQLYQRAIMATVMQAYSKGKAIFDHSFEGKEVGAMNQQRFMSVNAKALRDAIAHDIDVAAQTSSTSQGRVVAPGSTSPVPFSYIISEGSYEQHIFTTTISQQLVSMPAVATGETTQDYVNRIGLIVDDYYTIVVFAASNIKKAFTSNLGDLACQPQCEFAYLRLHVKQEAFSDDTPLENFGQIFEPESSVNGTDFELSDIEMTAGITIADVINNTQLSYGAIGVIRSRLDRDLRSNTRMEFTSALGIIARYLLQIWSAGTQTLGNSELILEGGNKNGDWKYQIIGSPVIAVASEKDSNAEGGYFGKYFVTGQTEDGSKKLLVRVNNDGTYVKVDVFNFNLNATAAGTDNGNLYAQQYINEAIADEPALESVKTPEEFFQYMVNATGENPWSSIGITSAVDIAQAVRDLLASTGKTYTVIG